MKLLNLGCGNRFHTDWTNVDFHAAAEGVMECDLLNDLPFADGSFDVVYHSHLLEHFPVASVPKFVREGYRILKPGGIVRIVVPDLERLARDYLSQLEKALRGDKVARLRYEWIVIEMLDQMVRHKPGGAMLDYWRQDPMPAEDYVIERVGPEVRNALRSIRAADSHTTTGHSDNAVHRSDEEALRVGRFRLSGEVHQWMYDSHSLAVLLESCEFRDIRQCRADESSIPDFNSYGLDIEPDGSVRKPDSLFMEAVKPA